MRAITSILLLAGCSQILGLNNFQTASDGGGGSDGGIADAGSDASIDAQTGYACGELGSALAIVMGHPIRRLGSNAMYSSFGSAACDLLAGAPTALVLVGSNSMMTSSGADPDPHIQHGSAEIPLDAVELAVDTPQGSNITLEVMVVSTFDLEAGAVLRPIGPAPLIILSSGEIKIEGMLDVSAGGPGTGGPGLGPCQDGKNGQFAGTTGDGGGGGAFQGSGGNGGAGSGGAMTSPGAPLPASNALYFPYSGCQGGAGGDTGGAGSPLASLPGGAVYLVSETGISVAGAINAGGQGGQFSDVAPLDGGGGGASGGTILLEAPVVSVSGAIAANGGGGASGTDGSENGVNGTDGTASSTRTPAGGSGAGGGGLGAAGTFLNGAPGMPGTAVRGGGGGGGGTGFIVLHDGSQPITMGSGTISPMWTILPM